MPNTVFIDGDNFREYMSQDLSYTVEDREINAFRQFNLCRLLDAQGVTVICCILSNQPQLEILKRRELDTYFEIFIDASLETLKMRDSKGMYKRAEAGTLENVVGIDIEFVPPQCPDMHLNNDNFYDIEAVVDDIISRLPGMETKASNFLTRHE